MKSQLLAARVISTLLVLFILLTSTPAALLAQDIVVPTLPPPTAETGSTQAPSPALPTLAPVPPASLSADLLTGVQSVSAGGGHTCALTNAGGVKCWGDNYWGQLGDGTTVNRVTPVNVSGLSSGVQAISAGADHTCALTTAGGIKCWGWNVSGQLGSNIWGSSPNPIDVEGLTSGVVAVDAGWMHTCAITASGAAKCWGQNFRGEIGDGTSGYGVKRWAPVDVSGLTIGVKAISAGGAYTCAVTSVGGVKCWGSNDYGELGDGTQTDHSVPGDVVGLTTGVLAVVTSFEHTCALTEAGGVKCWGINLNGQLGSSGGGVRCGYDGQYRCHLTPIDVVEMTHGIQAVTVGSEHTCALTKTGGVKCWGAASNGVLGDGATYVVPTDKPTPVDVAGLTSGVQAIDAGGTQHTCAITMEGSVRCWGSNKFGQLGDGTTTDYFTPVDGYGLSGGVQAIDTKSHHTCALTSLGGVKCWGGNNAGQVGDGTTVNRWQPADVVGLAAGVTAISVGSNHTCALMVTGAVKCWGYNANGQLGDTTTATRLTPIDVVGLTDDVQAISAGGVHTCALTTSGAVKCWGPTLVDISGLSSGVQMITAGHEHTCALTSVGGVKCWGDNYFGQLGDGTTTSSSVPVDVTGLTSGVKAISANGWRTCALKSSGGIRCWGTHASELNGSTFGALTITAGWYHTCALTTSDAVKCWGLNDFGKLGDGTTLYRSEPVNVVGLTSSMQSISAGGNHTCALTMAGGVKCWGSNEYGQLAARTGWTPVDVLAGAPAIDVAELGSQAGYPTLAPNQTFDFWINVRNGGTTTWRAADGYGYRGTEQWLGRNGSVWRDVPPGDVLSFSETVTVPTTPGKYIYGFIMYHGDAQFGPHFFLEATVTEPATKPTVVLLPGIMGSLLETANSGSCSSRPSGVAWIDIRQTALGKLNVFSPDLFDTLFLDPTGQLAANHPCDVVSPKRLIDTYGILSSFDIYKGFIEYLQDDYKVLSFPYDWRLNIDDPAGTNDIVGGLDAFIDANLPTGSKVVLIGHSMGGLVARAYVANEARSAKVEKVITVGTPYLGAPQAAYVMMTGKPSLFPPLPQIGITDTQHIFGPWMGQIKAIIRNAPGALQLLPSREYVDEYPYYTAYGTLFTSLDATNSWFEQEGKNRPLLVTADSFHQRLDSFTDNYAFSGDYWVLAARNRPTISAVRQQWCPSSSLACYRTEEHMMGDETVPQTSSRLMVRGGAPIGPAKLCTYSSTSNVAKHGSLMADPTVQADILNILQGGQPTGCAQPSQVQSAVAEAAPALREIMVWGNAEVRVEDDQGGFAGIDASGLLTGTLADVSFDFLPNASVVTFPAGAPYLVSARNLDGGAPSVTATDFNAPDVESALTMQGQSLFTNLPISNTGTFIISNAGAALGSVSVTVDADSDGTPERTVPPDAVLTDPVQAQDSTAPATTITLQGPQDAQGHFTTAVTVSLAAQDAGAAGVLKSYYSLDGSATWQVYSQPFQVAPGQATIVSAHSLDKAGNAEYPPNSVQIQFAGDARVFLPMVQSK